MICSEFVEQALQQSSPNHKIIDDPITKSFLPSTFANNKNVTGVYSLNLTRPGNDLTHLLDDSPRSQIREAKSSYPVCFFVNDKLHHCDKMPRDISLAGEHQIFSLPFCETDGYNRVCADVNRVSAESSRRLTRFNFTSEHNPFFAFGAAAMLLIGLYYLLTGRFHQKHTTSKVTSPETTITHQPK